MRPGFAAPACAHAHAAGRLGRLAPAAAAPAARPARPRARSSMRPSAAAAAAGGPIRLEPGDKVLLLGITGITGRCAPAASRTQWPEAPPAAAHQPLHSTRRAQQRGRPAAHARQQHAAHGTHAHTPRVQVCAVGPAGWRAGAVAARGRHAPPWQPGSAGGGGAGRAGAASTRMLLLLVCIVLAAFLAAATQL